MTRDSDRTTLADDTVRNFNQNVESPSFFCGGGSVAAISASSAAALTLLVMRLNLDRKRNLDYRSEIENQINSTQSIQQQLYDAADSDLDVLDALLVAQRSMKETGQRDAYHLSLIAAALSPYEICRLCLQLLSTIDAQIPRASRFTVSDLGAAAALALGSIQGAMLTTDVNVALLRDEADVDQVRIERIQSDADELIRDASDIAERIRDRTLGVIRKPTGRRQP